MEDILPVLLKDFYKVGHVHQYPAGVTNIFVNWTGRYGLDKNSKHYVTLGHQYWILEYLRLQWSYNFFHRSWKEINREYKEVCRECLGVDDFNTDHLKHLHGIGHLPLKIYALPEGSAVPYGVPSMVLVNTDPKCFWLPNMLETNMSSVLWLPSTSATTAQSFRKLFVRHAKESGITDMTPINFMGHDFSYRGMEGTEGACLSGFGHLTAFDGTDTIPAIKFAKRYYCADLSCGKSVPATEHSVMCAGGKETELETFSRILDVYPKGPVSIVSDTWNLWKVALEVAPALREKILARDGVLVLRPDSGDPVKIVIGDERAWPLGDYKVPGRLDLQGINPAFYGLASLLEAVMGSQPGPGGNILNKTAIIYGDAINYERADAILTGLRKKGLSIINQIFGIGSFSYQFRTRDNHGFAAKATAMKMAGSDEVFPLFKKPVTDSGGKNSHHGIPAVFGPNGGFVVEQNSDEETLDNCAFEKVFDNGDLLVTTTLEEIRKRVRSYVE